MQKPNLPQNEKERLQELIRLEILDTGPESHFDDLTKLASEICGTKISLISLIDENRQWFKSKVGLDASETPRDISWCGHAILEDEIFEIPDAEKDDRFRDNPLYTGAPHVRFYAGAPLKSSHGYNIGTLCVIDNNPQKLNEWQRSALKKLAHQVVLLLEGRLREKKLAATNEKLDAIVNNIPLSLVIYNKQGEIQWVNNQWRRDYDYQENELIHQQISHLFKLEDTPKEQEFFFSTEKRPWKRLIINSKAGEPIFTRWNQVTLGSHQHLGIGKNIHQEVLNDLETKRLEKSLEEQKKIAQHQAKLASLGQLAAGVGHEINNPLAIIKGFLSALENDVTEHPTENSRALYLIKKIDHATDRIVNIVKGLKSFSRVDSSEFEKFAINECIQNTLQLVTEIYKKEGYQINFSDLTTSSMIIFGNKGRFEQVLLNLISNAKDAMEGSSQKEIEIKVAQEPKKVILSIQDHGKGIPEEIKDKIFDPFFTTKDVNKGTGIGLSIVDSIVKEMEGTIHFESSEKGTTFYLEFPLMAD